MQWLESITLRIAHHDRYKLVRDFIRPITDHATDQGLINIKIFKHAVLENDLIIHIYWDTDPSAWHKTSLGYQLIEVLGCFGLTDHSAWVESGVK